MERPHTLEIHTLITGIAIPLRHPYLLSSLSLAESVTDDSKVNRKKKTASLPPHWPDDGASDQGGGNPAIQAHGDESATMTDIAGMFDDAQVLLCCTVKFRVDFGWCVVLLMRVVRCFIEATLE